MSGVVPSVLSRSGILLVGILLACAPDPAPVTARAFELDPAVETALAEAGEVRVVVLLDIPQLEPAAQRRITGGAGQRLTSTIAAAVDELLAELPATVETEMEAVRPMAMAMAGVR